MSQLFTPLKIRSIQLKNRLVVSPMCQYSSEGGFANDWHLVHLGTRAIGGAGLVFTEAAAVSPEGRITPDDLGIWKDEHIEYLKRITDFIHENGSIAGIQLAHAGRKASMASSWKGGKMLDKENGGWETIAPSEIAFSEEYKSPQEMSSEDIDQLRSEFRSAARRAVEAGFKVIEIHAAHGYLLNEFLSPLSNKRKDEFGGSFENRVRLLLKITQEIRSEIGEEIPLFVRISATEWVEGGWNEVDSVALAKLLKVAGADLIDCSTGGNIPGVRIPVVPLYQTPFAEIVKREAKVMTGAVGLITKSTEAESIISEKRADLVFMARELLRNPYFPLLAAHELDSEVAWPVQYERAKWRK